MSKRTFTEDSWSRDSWFRSLCAAIADCKNEQEIAQLLRDLGTLSELQAWSERLEVAKHLHQGKSYRETAKITGASTTTVTRVAKCLQEGNGYKKYFGEEDATEERPTGVQTAGALRKYLN